MDRYKMEEQLYWLDKRLQSNQSNISVDYYKIQDISKQDLENICKCYGYIYHETFEQGYRDNYTYKIANFNKLEFDKEED